MVERIRDYDDDNVYVARDDAPMERRVVRRDDDYNEPSDRRVVRRDADYHDHDNTSRVTRREVVQEDGPIAETVPVAPPAFSVGATFLGWCVASFLTFVFLGLVGLALAPEIAEATDGGAVTLAEAQDLGIVAALGALLAVFLGYLVGGYAAGRISIWHGVLHGALVPVWTILFALLAWAIGIATAANLGFVVTSIDLGNITGATILALVVTLAVMFAGAALGGAWGERVDEDAIEASPRARTTRYGRTY